MIAIDMEMPIQCDCCRFCLTEYTDDNKLCSYAYCCAAERFIAQASDGTDRVVSTAILKKQPWCPLKFYQPRALLREAMVDGKSQEIISGFTLYCPNCGFANRFVNPRWWTISPRENTVFYCGKCGMEVKWE